MRLWQDTKGAVLTDDQLLRYIAAFGDLAGAAQAGDIRLISDESDVPGRKATVRERTVRDSGTASCERPNAKNPHNHPRRLADYLKGAE